MSQQTFPIPCFPDPRLVSIRPDIICIMPKVKPASWPLPCKCINKDIPEQLTLTVAISLIGGIPPVSVDVSLLVNGRTITTVSSQSSGEPIRVPFQGIASHLQAGENVIEIQVTARDAIGRTASGSGRLDVTLAVPLPLTVQVGVEQ